ncbi:MAG TPA: hypothetical protein DCS18_13825 [Alcanivorax sp.]|nr:hypothetical protein [Alcanivorax sp.]
MANFHFVDVTYSEVCRRKMNIATVCAINTELPIVRVLKVPNEAANRDIVAIRVRCSRVLRNSTAGDFEISTIGGGIYIDLTLKSYYTLSSENGDAEH